MWLLDRAYLSSYRNGEMTTGSFFNAAVISTLSAIAGVVAAVLAVQIVQRISDFQSAPLPAQSSSD